MRMNSATMILPCKPSASANVLGPKDGFCSMLRILRGGVQPPVDATVARFHVEGARAKVPVLTAAGNHEPLRQER